MKNSTNCLNITSILLEDNGESGSAGSHWDKSWVNNEYMSPQISPSMMYISDMTLALFEDMGWYIAKYNYSIPL